MKKSHKKGLVVVIVAAVILGGAFLLFRKKTAASPMTKQQKVTAIILNPASATTSADYNGMIGFGDDYIDAWYNALVNKQPSFTLAGKTYRSKGGTAF